MGARFRTDGLRTDGREVRPHKPWRVNDGTETANRSVAPGPQTPRTDFNSALAPRLGGLMQPRLAGRMEPSNSMQGPTMAGAPLTGRPFPAAPRLPVPSDGPSAPPMFAGVSDMGAEPTLNTAQKWTRAGKQAAVNGWVTTTPQQVRNIASRYSTPTNSRLALGGSSKPLPY